MDSTSMVRLWPGYWLPGLSSHQRHRPKEQKKLIIRKDRLASTRENGTSLDRLVKVWTKMD
jgi:hypothetical protein